MIHLNHIELTTPEGTPPDGEDGTLLRYWQAEVPGTDLYALTEEACTRTGENRYLRLTRFFVGTKPASDGGPFGGILIQDELNHGDHFTGTIAQAIRELPGPTSWTDKPRQRLLDDAIEQQR